MHRLQLGLLLFAMSFCETPTAVASRLLDSAVLEATTKETSGADRQGHPVAADASTWSSASAVPGVDANVLQKTAFKSLGGQSFSRACCVSWGPGRIDCFVRGPGSNVLHTVIETKVDGSREYSGWHDLGGEVVDEVECVSRGVGLLDVIGIGRKSDLVTNAYTSKGWTGWKSVETWNSLSNERVYTRETPSCSVSEVSDVDCFVPTARCTGAYFKLQDGGKIVKYSAGPGGCYTFPWKCILTVPDTFSCFGAGPSNALNGYPKTTRNWRRWWDPDVWIRGRPSATTWGRNRIDVFVLATTGDVKQKTFDGTTWKKAVSLGGSLESPPECITFGVGKIHCFAIGKGSRLYMNSLEGETWSGWKSLGGRFLEQPSCLISDDDEISCYIRGSAKNIIELVFDFSETPAH